MDAASAHFPLVRPTRAPRAPVDAVSAPDDSWLPPYVSPRHGAPCGALRPQGNRTRPGLAQRAHPDHRRKFRGPAPTADLDPFVPGYVVQRREVLQGERSLPQAGPDDPEEKPSIFAGPADLEGQAPRVGGAPAPPRAPSPRAAAPGPVPLFDGSASPPWSASYRFCSELPARGNTRISNAREVAPGGSDRPRRQRPPPSREQRPRAPKRRPQRRQGS